MARTCSNINSSNNHEGASAVCASLLLHALLIAVLNTPPALSLLIGKETRFDLFWIVPQGASAPPLAATAAAAEEELAGGVAAKAAPSQGPAVAGREDAAAAEEDEDDGEPAEASSGLTLSPSPALPLRGREQSDNMVLSTLPPSTAHPLQGRVLSHSAGPISLTAQKHAAKAIEVMSSPRQKLPITDAAAPTPPPLRRGNRGDLQPAPSEVLTVINHSDSIRADSKDIVASAPAPSPTLPLRGRGLSGATGASSLTEQKSPAEATRAISSPRQKLPSTNTNAAAPTSLPLRRVDRADLQSAPPARQAALGKEASPVSRSGQDASGGNTSARRRSTKEAPPTAKAIPAPTTIAAKEEAKAKPSDKPPEPRGMIIPSLRGDLKMVITGDTGIRLTVLFRDYPKARRKTMQSKAEARRVQKVTPVVVKTREETREAVIETAREGIYLFTAEADKGETAKATFTLKIYESGSRERVAAIGSRPVGGKTVLARVLMPEGILWDDDSAFTGSLEDSDSTTKFNAQTGIYWKEYHD